jgi:phosphoribosyl 1,2-cyclic phosphodiesterase
MIQAGERVIILDAGTGIRLLGQDLMKAEFGKGKGEATIFFSHNHWDHIQGFPFFLPAYVPGNKFHIYGPQNIHFTLEDSLAGQQEHSYFPVELKEMPSDITFHELKMGEEVNLGAVKIINQRLGHPGGVFAYRIESEGKSFVYATDTEHYAVIDWRLLELAKNADILAYDSMYTPEEYEKDKKISWGHSTYKAGIKLAEAASVKELHLIHHDPVHSDDFLDRMEEEAQKLFPHSYLAREGWEIEL